MWRQLVIVSRFKLLVTSFALFNLDPVLSLHLHVTDRIWTSLLTSFYFFKLAVILVLTYWRVDRVDQELLVGKSTHFPILLDLNGMLWFVQDVLRVSFSSETQTPCSFELSPKLRLLGFRQRLKDLILQLE